ncbi:MAG TPA: MerR family transcriptional regulator [Thermoanaerobaculia bacterium]|nr:MerR family transcriptional regulator [Thermoanaerobaculia bacterium]
MFGIGEVARRVGVRPSTVRYYEARGLVAADRRVGGKRVYGQEAIERLALIAFAKKLGFSLAEIRTLFDGFSADIAPGRRWSDLAATKLAELDAMSKRIDLMRAALHKISQCGCADLDQCARAIAAKTSRDASAPRRAAPEDRPRGSHFPP